jgi:serine/threonine-protein kinase
MTSHPHHIDSGDVQLELVQQRLALLGKVMLFLTALLVLAQAVGNNYEDLLRPSYWFIVASGGFWLALFLDCRGAPRSATRLRVMEAVCILGWVTSMGIGVRLLMVDQFPDLYLGVASQEEVARASLIILFEKAGAVSVTLVMSLALTIRAAAVPTNPRYTAVLTIAAGILYLAPWIIEPAIFEMSVDRSIGYDSVALTLALSWTMIVITCYVVSRVVYGLRAEVRDAQKLGQYTLVSKIGEGGMGVVYRARHAMMQRPTAIKLLSGSGSSELELVRFEREVQLTAKLTHPNTITIFDYGRTPDGIFYYVMELLDGASLQAVIEHDGPQPAERVVSILLQIAGALEEAHTIGLIHRDIKPANIILCAQGGRPDVAKLLDFGLVKHVTAETVSDATVEGTISGTPHYMAPEQITASESIDGRCDLYALGALGYYALTGRHMFEGKTPVEIFADHLHTKPDAPSKMTEVPVTPALDAVILSCLEKDPADRPGSAAELAERLRACDVGEWSVERARAWWDTNGRNLEQTDGGDSSPKTIAVDMARIRKWSGAVLPG